MLVKSISAKSNTELSFKIASWIRKGYEIADIIIKYDDSKPYKAFLVNKKYIEDKIKDKSSKDKNEFLETFKGLYYPYYNIDINNKYKKIIEVNYNSIIIDNRIYFLDKLNDINSDIDSKLERIKYLYHK